MMSYSPFFLELAKNIFDFEPKTIVYRDPMGRFPHISSCGYQYILLVFDYDSNVIFQQALRNRTAKEITHVRTKIHTQLKTLQCTVTPIQCNKMHAHQYHAPTSNMLNK